MKQLLIFLFSYTALTIYASGRTVIITTNIVSLKPPCPEVSLTKNDSHCWGSDDGRIIASVTGGVPPGTYSWSDPLAANGATGLKPGNYCLTVTDAAGCSVFSCVTITEPPKLVVTITTTSDTNGQSNGSASFSVIGGSTLASYSWSNGSLGNPITGLSCGTYSISVSDNNGCTGTATAVVACVTGVNELNDEKSLSIYPNPANAIIAIESSIVEPYTIQLLNMLGETVYGIQEMVTGKTTID
ncbi:MAG: SprB repeat-containing protein, partial [Bacteroidia bacterium]|nr:SprB repeat-containing protein [Bacteroidia bacterium]